MNKPTPPPTTTAAQADYHDSDQHPYHIHVRSCEACSGPYGHCSEGLRLLHSDRGAVDQDSGNKEKNSSSPPSQILKDNLLRLYESKSYFDLNDIAGRRGYSLAHLPYVQTPEARRELVDWLTAYDERLLVPTQDTETALRGHNPDDAPASSVQHDPVSSESSSPAKAAARRLADVLIDNVYDWMKPGLSEEEAKEVLASFISKHTAGSVDQKETSQATHGDPA